MESHCNTEDSEEVISDQTNISSFLRVLQVQQLIKFLIFPRQWLFRAD